MTYPKLNNDPELSKTKTEIEQIKELKKEKREPLS